MSAHILVFIHGKGGVGKTAIAEAMAKNFASHQKRTLLVRFEGSTSHEPCLYTLNYSFIEAFHEYVGIKIGSKILAKTFLKNTFITHLAQIAPGLKDLVLLGKICHMCSLYDKVVIDMPSTGYGVAMLHSAYNFAALFHAGPLYQDALSMIKVLETNSLLVRVELLLWAI